MTQVNGTIGLCVVPRSALNLASFDSKTFDQSESIGIVKTHGMQSRMYWSLRNRKA